jgi:hypothetical protein
VDDVSVHALRRLQRELYAQRAVLHSSSTLARKYEALQDAHEVLKLEAARDKAALAGQRCAHRTSVPPLHSSQRLRCRLAAAAPSKDSRLEEREIGERSWPRLQHVGPVVCASKHHRSCCCMNYTNTTPCNTTHATAVCLQLYLKPL